MDAYSSLLYNRNHELIEAPFLHVEFLFKFLPLLVYLISMIRRIFVWRIINMNLLRKSYFTTDYYC